MTTADQLARSQSDAAYCRSKEADQPRTVPAANWDIPIR